DLIQSDAKKQRLLQQDEPYNHELRLRMPDGSERWLSAHAEVRSNRIFGINFDITQRKQAEAQLREREERLPIAPSGAALGVFRPVARLLVFSNGTPRQVMQAGKMSACTRFSDVREPMGPSAKRSSSLPACIPAMRISLKTRSRTRARLAAVFRRPSELRAR